MSSEDVYEIVEQALECVPCPINSTCVVHIQSGAFFCIETRSVADYNKFPIALTLLIIWNLVLTLNTILRIGCPTTHQKLCQVFIDFWTFATTKLRKTSQNEREISPPTTPNDPKTKIGKLYPDISDVERGEMVGEDERGVRGIQMKNSKFFPSADNNFNGIPSAPSENIDETISTDATRQNAQKSGGYDNESVKTAQTGDNQEEMPKAEDYKKSETDEESNSEKDEFTAPTDPSANGDDFTELAEWLDK